MMTYRELLAVDKYLSLRHVRHVRNPKLYPAVDLNTVEIARKSEREYDLSISGKTKDGMGFGAWLPLGLISCLDWTADPVAGMTDYPEMARDGDWSGVRDTEEEKLWAIFNKFYNFTK